MNRIIDESENREAYEAGLITAEERERRDDEARTKCRAAIERDEAADDQRQIEKMRKMGLTEQEITNVLRVLECRGGINYRAKDFAK